MIQLEELLGHGMSTRTKAAVVKKKVECKCLICDQPSARGHRGLCKYHYFQFNRAWRRRKTRAQKLEFELEQIRKGRVLASIRGQHGKPNPFEQD